MYYRKHAEPINNDILDDLEQRALENTKSLRKQGRRRTYAKMPPIRLEGPLTLEALEEGITFSHLLKCPPVKNKAKPAVWPAKSFEMVIPGIP